MNSLVDSTHDQEHRPEVVERTELCGEVTARRVAAMLDLESMDLKPGDELPRGWQFVLMAADTKRSLLRADGFPGLGVTMPDLGLPRLLLGSRSVSYLKDIPIGASVGRRSCIQSLTHKSTKAGPLAVATIQHELTLGNDPSPALVESQTYLLLPASKGSSPSNPTVFTPIVTGQKVKTVVPDETVLFQYSALGFNSHKIHIDRAHARNVEGFPDLVVNGGLATLYLTEFLRQDMGVRPASYKVKHVAPLFCGSPITMVANQVGTGWHLQAFDNRSMLAIDMEVVPYEL